MTRRLTWLLLLFAVSFTFFAIQSGDALMYLNLVRDFLSHGELRPRDPYLYSLPNAELHIAHEYLSYLLFYGAYEVFGFSGLILLKMIVLGGIFILILASSPRERNSSPLFMGLWILAVMAACFRFIERTSLFSDLFTILLLSWLVEARAVTRGLVLRLGILFFLWVQMHPGFPMGIALLGIWAAWNWIARPEFRRARVAWLILPLAVLVANPLFVEGALYPFRFALDEAQVLKHYNFEWFPTYHPAFRWTPEVIAYWGLLLAALFLLAREKAWLTLRGALALFTMLCGLLAVRFVPWTAFALLLLLKPWCEFRVKFRFVRTTLAVLMLIVSAKNLITGYTGSSGPRVPRAGLDSKFFPERTVEFLRANPIPGNLYNAHDFGSYLIWTGATPIFHHGFVTDMDFYERDVVGALRSQARFLELAKKYGWTKLLVDKHGTYPYFFRILSPLPDWKIVAEDDASYLIYLLPERKK